MANKIQLRRDVANVWGSVNPILAQGEMGVEVDTGRFKFGDGVTRWVNLRYSPFDFTTSNVAEGPTNFYFTNARAIDAVFPKLTTANVTELTNLYFSNARVRAVYDQNLDSTQSVRFANVYLPNEGILGPVQYSNGIDLYGSANTGYVQLNYNNENYVFVDSSGAYLQTPNVFVDANSNTKTLTITISNSGNNKVWIFDSNGDLTVPSEGSQIIHNGLFLGTETTSAYLDLPNNTNANIWGGLRVGNDGGPITILANSHNWEFTYNGELSLPASDSGEAVISIPTDQSLVIKLEDAESGQANVEISQNGTLTLPSQLHLENEKLVVFYNNTMQVWNKTANALRLIVGSDYGNSPRWDFNPNGSITFPDGSVQTEAFVGLISQDIANLLVAGDSITIEANGRISTIPPAALTGSDVANVITAGNNIVINANGMISANVTTVTNRTVKRVGTAGTTSVDIGTEKVVFADCNAATGNITLTLTNPADGSDIVVKNINSGGFTCFVNATTIETLSGAFASSVPLSNSGSTATWVYDSISTAYRLVSKID